MNTETFEFLGFQGQRLFATLWLPDGAPRGVLQITHGMTEHIGRYTALAKALTQRGFVAAGFDLQGHGRNPGNTEIASFGEEGWEHSLQDMHLFSGCFPSASPDVPTFCWASLWAPSSCGSIWSGIQMEWQMLPFWEPAISRIQCWEL